MSQVLAIDPGISTGYVLVNDIDKDPSAELSVKVSGTIAEEDLKKSDLQKLANRTRLQVVIEHVPHPTGGDLAERLMMINQYISYLFPNALKIMPGQWKPVTQHLRVPAICKTRHEQDAFRIAYYYRYYVTRRINHAK